MGAHLNILLIGQHQDRDTVQRLAYDHLLWGGQRGSSERPSSASTQVPTSLPTPHGRTWLAPSCPGVAQPPPSPALEWGLCRQNPPTPRIPSLAGCTHQTPVWTQTAAPRPWSR